MDDYIQEMFKRVRLQNIEQYLMDGGEQRETEFGSYQERLNSSEETLDNALQEIIPDHEMREKVENIFSLVMVNREDIYMELGMKLGAILQRQLME